ncbi:hypothetical protein JP33_09145 [Gallibacterium anatis CCM5995]|uniref:Uncharacterized protein n=2 Tax=Gallibacterium anatis TaxID=750 RepID=A0A0A3AW90_9PAST|nr:hypothetical protein JP27_10965 [Gallibacterium anatis]KGQ24162.1 hypothetical protein JP33_09145 [Gallibacterium anatis CCM5995]KGQ41046.1 hypothetical protein JP30_05535 [Gallibacterium anatis IPDH697-78]KGQ50940.1 hypothetical protein JL12_04035 [Gallibacterium anatis 10672-6]KGQ55450.1 hypothetical protein IO44_06035 [Gallibacterium anatis str. Avicor]KGQ57961.1 hypothetical protein IE01_02970 [Gallibacterium anatis DSM 16844 = F 149]KGQ62010.1 hypothetical protein IO48_06135 [Gallibac
MNKIKKIPVYFMGSLILTDFSPISKRGYEAKRLVVIVKPVSTVTVQSVCPHRKNIGRNVTLVKSDSQVSRWMKLDFRD